MTKKRLGTTPWRACVTALLVFMCPTQARGGTYQPEDGGKSIITRNKNYFQEKRVLRRDELAEQTSQNPDYRNPSVGLLRPLSRIVSAQNRESRIIVHTTPFYARKKWAPQPTNSHVRGCGAVVPCSTVEHGTL